MEDNQYITMVIRWNKQQRPIKININDDLNDIETTIHNTYQLQVNNLYKYQIQYYNSEYEKFMDLYSADFNLFQKLLCTLLSPEAPPKPAKEWILKIVPKNVETIRPIIHESATDDTYNYQQENDPTESPQNEEPSSTIYDAQPSPPSNETRFNNSEGLLREPVLQNTDEDHHQETARSGIQSPQLLVVNSQIVITTDHPYGLAFIDKLADHQRQQYEREMIRKSQSGTTIGGVILRARHRLDITSSNDKPYPRIHFQIPSHKRNVKWFLHICILTEADSNGNHYLHASKGIYVHDAERTTREDEFGMIKNTKSFNPYVVELSEDNLQDEIYQINIKVCNMKNLPDRNHEQLRDFARLDSREAYNNNTSLSEKTTLNSKFSSAKYHVGCSLESEGAVYDRCISSLTTTVQNRRRNDPQEPKQRQGARVKRKSDQQSESGRRKNKRK